MPGCCSGRWWPVEEEFQGSKALFWGRAGLGRVGGGGFGIFAFFGFVDGWFLVVGGW